MYEANPISFIVEQAGGAATTGRFARIMEVPPEGIHQRVPLIFGSKAEVERIVGYHQDYLQGRDDSFSMPLFTTRSLFRSQ